MHALNFFAKYSNEVHFHLNKKLLLLHLGMSGKLLLMRKKDKKLFKTSFYYNLNILHKHNHIFFILNNGLILIYNDIRRFGFFKIFNNKDLNKINFLKKLGLEPFDTQFNLNYFKNFSKSRKKKY